MTLEEFEKLIKKDRYQVFIFTSPCSIPIAFAKHTWFVVNRKGTVSRWEVLLRFGRKEKAEYKWGYLYKNFLPETTGLEIIPFSGSGNWRSNLLKYLEGDENSTIQKMAEFIENSNENYTNKEIYHLLGPNSNTYIQSVLYKFPELNIKLPWNCFGKNYIK